MVGASLAGLRAAEELRRLGHGGAITLVGAEQHRPYDRPPLSKQVLTGAAEPGATALAVTEALRPEWRLGVEASGLDTAGRRVLLADGSTLPYDGLVLATGASPRRLPALPAGDGVHYLRTLDDAVALRADLGPGRKLVVVGAGFVGLEVACSAAAMGAKVVVLEALPVPLERALGADMGATMLDWHRSKGLDLRTGVVVRGLERGADGRPEAVRLADGSALPADVVVVGIGAAPQTGWLEGSGVDLSDGIVCDRHLRVSAAGEALEGVVAAGDVARWWHDDHGEAVRVEHWTHAVESGETSARNLWAQLSAHTAEDLEVYRPVPYFWSDQHGVKIQFVGHTAPGDDIEIVEGSFADDRVLVAFGREGRLVAALGIRRPARVMAFQRMISEGAPFPPEA